MRLRSAGALWIGGRHVFGVGRFIIKCFNLASAAVSAIPDTGVALVFLSKVRMSMCA